MKKHIIGIIAFAAIAVVAGWGYIQNKQNVVLSDLALENVEALANGEANPGDPCYKGAYDSTLPEAIKCAHPCVKERCGGAVDKCY